MTTDGVSHTGTRLIDPRKTQPDGAHVADVMRMSLAAAYAHEQFAYAGCAFSVRADHFTEQRDAGVVADTDLVLIDTLLVYLPVGILRVVAEVQFLPAPDTNTIAQTQIKLNDAVQAVYAASHESAVFQTATEPDEYGLARSRAIYTATNPPVDGGLVWVQVFFATVDTNATAVAVQSRPISVSVWTEAV